MYAMVEIKGKQYKAEKGAVLTVDRLSQEAGDKVEFDTVLLTSNDKEVKVGTPYVKGAKVVAKVEDEIKAKKIKVFKFKRRKGYRLTQGHRQKYTRILVEEIAGL